MNNFHYVNQNMYLCPPLPFNLISEQQQYNGQCHQYWQPMMNSMATPVSFSVASRKRSLEQPEEKITLGGKWTAEEEAYASVLIQHFRTGALPDCEDGTTLRSYLAEKLQCIPMRISKKYAGIRIGKEIFRRGRTSPEVIMHLNYIRDLFIQSTSKKRKRIKRKMLKAPPSAKADEKDALETNSASADTPGDQQLTGSDSTSEAIDSCSSPLLKSESGS